MQDEKQWDLIVKPKKSVFDINIGEVFKYKDLILLMVKRDFVAVYKQTILGPLWFIIQPVIQAFVFSFVFGRWTNINFGGVSPILFYLSGLTLWIYFADCVTKTATTFIANASVFGKVYFPRLVIPISVVISNLIKLVIQLSIFLCFWLFNLNTINPNFPYLFLLPVLILIIAMLGFGFGILISSFTTKYRDLNVLVGFGIQLLMYFTIIIPVSKMSGLTQTIALLNPVAPIIEAFKFIFLGSECGYFSWLSITYSLIFAVFIVLIAVFSFNKVEQSFMDTV